MSGRTVAIRAVVEVDARVIPVHIKRSDRIKLEQPPERVDDLCGRARHDRAVRELMIDVHPEHARVGGLLERPPSIHARKARPPVTPGHHRRSVLLGWSASILGPWT